jgi:hypothetical protein
MEFKEEDFVKDRIATWAIACDTAKDNADLLIKDHMKHHEECARRMRVLGVAEDEMLRLADRSNLPAPLKRFINANDDRGCSGCWLSSAGPSHPECAAKIDEWFTSRRLLVQYGLGFTQNIRPPRPEVEER